ncbi:MAG: FMN-binding protein [Planctomycetota bacterium]
MVKGNLYALVYAAVLGTVCALLLTAAGSFTAPYQADNLKAERIFNILTVLGVPFETKAPCGQLVEIFNRNIKQQERGGRAVYVYMPDMQSGVVQALAVEFSGSGLWGPVKGFLSLNGDMKTIRGIAFHEQQETPGLGGEIGSVWFRGQFEGKSVFDESGNIGIVIGGQRGKAIPNGVDAITGATMTCRKVEDMLNTVIKKIAEKQDK